MTPRFFETAGSRLGAGPRAFQAVHIIAFPIQKRKEQNNENPSFFPPRFWRGRTARPLKRRPRARFPGARTN